MIDHEDRKTGPETPEKKMSLRDILALARAADDDPLRDRQHPDAVWARGLDRHDPNQPALPANRLIWVLLLERGRREEAKGSRGDREEGTRNKNQKSDRKREKGRSGTH